MRPARTAPAAPANGRSASGSGHRRGGNPGPTAAAVFGIGSGRNGDTAVHALAACGVARSGRHTAATAGRRPDAARTAHTGAAATARDRRGNRTTGAAATAKGRQPCPEGRRPTHATSSASGTGCAARPAKSARAEAERQLDLARAEDSVIELHPHAAQAFTRAITTISDALKAPTAASTPNPSPPCAA